MTARSTLEDLADQHEIEQLMYRYATGIDTADYDLVDSVFTDDGEVDYAGIGGPRGRWHPEVRQWSVESLAAFPVRKHYITNVVVTYAPDGATATSVTYWRSPMGFARVRMVPSTCSNRAALPRRARAHRRRVADRRRATAQDWMWGTLPPELTGEDAPEPGTR